MYAVKGKTWWARTGTLTHSYITRISFSRTCSKLMIKKVLWRFQGKGRKMENWQLKSYSFAEQLLWRANLRLVKLLERRAKELEKTFSFYWDWEPMFNKYYLCFFNSFKANVPFLYLLKITENWRLFHYFQGV